MHFRIWFLAVILNECGAECLLGLLVYIHLKVDGVGKGRLVQNLGLLAPLNQTRHRPCQRIIKVIRTNSQRVT
jgi:hypothetical protein